MGRNGPDNADYIGQNKGRDIAYDNERSPQVARQSGLLDALGPDDSTQINEVNSPSKLSRTKIKKLKGNTSKSKIGTEEELP